MLCICAQQPVGGPDDGGEEMHPRSKATRRGPMDEMRQLVRNGGHIGALTASGRHIEFLVPAHCR